MSTNTNQTDPGQANQVVQNNAQNSEIRAALLRLRQLGASLPEIDAAAVVRAGREIDIRIN